MAEYPQVPALKALIPFRHRKILLRHHGTSWFRSYGMETVLPRHPFLHLIIRLSNSSIRQDTCATITIASPTKTVEERDAKAACASAVTIAASSNPFSGRTLHANSAYASEIATAMSSVTDASIKAQASQVAQTGSFLWIDTIARVPLVATMLVETPCTDILGLVIYDLPGRDCAAKASNGELKTGELANHCCCYQGRTKRRRCSGHRARLLPQLGTNANLITCSSAKSDYESGVAYALKSLNHPNVAGWNAFSLSPGEFPTASDAKYNKCQDEKTYIDTFSPLTKKDGMPAYAIVDTGRNAVQGLRLAWVDWCNVNGAGFGVRPTFATGDSLVDAFVWVKPGGESDGTSDTTANGYDSFCGHDYAFKPSPQAGQWDEAYFEMLLKNAKPAFTG
ncbi:cellulase [Acephala macrosclerotiorum]|nr:cellulase [Acephala macrosclerotiorum]